LRDKGKGKVALPPTEDEAVRLGYDQAVRVCQGSLHALQEIKGGNKGNIFLATVECAYEVSFRQQERRRLLGSHHVFLMMLQKMQIVQVKQPCCPNNNVRISNSFHQDVDQNRC
jgi:hypothetical protein